MSKNNFMSNDCVPVKKYIEKFCDLGHKITFKKFLIIFVIILLIIELNKEMKTQ
jgi:hypothetical protein